MAITLEDVKFADWLPDGSDLAIVRRMDRRYRLECPLGYWSSPQWQKVPVWGSLVGRVSIVDQMDWLDRR